MTLTTIIREHLLGGLHLLSTIAENNHYLVRLLQLSWLEHLPEGRKTGQACHLDGHVPVSSSETQVHFARGSWVFLYLPTGASSNPAFCSAPRIVSCSVSGIGSSGGRTVVFSKIPNIFNASFVRAR